MCCSGDPVARNLEQTQAAFTETLNNSYKVTFANQQAVLASVTAQLNNAVSNPQGFSPKDLATLRTSSTDLTANQFKNAMVTAQTRNAATGGADLGSGVAAGITSDIAAKGAEAQAQNQQQITMANEELKQQNYWKGISGLQTVAGLESPAPVANAGANVANSATNAGNLLLGSQQAQWGDIGATISGIAGLGKSILTGGTGGGTIFSG